MRIVIDMQGAQGSAMHRGIGRYSLSLARAMVRNRGEHEVLLALSGFFPGTIEPIRAEFDRFLPQENIRVWHASGPLSHGTAANVWRRRAAEFVRESFLASLSPDVVYVTSLFEGWGWSDNSVTSVGLLTHDLPTAISLYDLIPLMNRDAYLTDEAAESWYENKLCHARRADLLLAISESSRQEAIRYLDFPGEKVINVGTAADDQFHRRELSAASAKQVLDRYSLRRFLMYTGGFDHRKNIDRLIRAYARVPESIRAEQQLAIVCAVPDDIRATMHGLARDLGLRPTDLVMTGFVPDDDLVNLYNLCTAFVFPSLHEGFGLPALEAMSCGAAVIASNTSSLPEVVGRQDALFDPFDYRSIAHKIEHVLADEDFRAELAAHGIQQSKKFSWDDTAKTAIGALERMNANVAIRTRTHRTRRRTLAFVWLASADESYLDDYCGQLIRELSRHYRIDVVLPRDRLPDPWIRDNCRSRTLESFFDSWDEYDRVLYSCGARRNIDESIFPDRLRPGVLILHADYQSSGEAWTTEIGKLQTRYVRNALVRLPASTRADLSRHSAKPFPNYPYDQTFIEQAYGVIVHSRTSLRAAAYWFGQSETEEWSVIPWPRSAAVAADRPAMLRRLGMPPDAFLVCCFVDAAGRHAADVLKAWSASALASDDCCHLVFLSMQRSEDWKVELLRILNADDSAVRVSLSDAMSHGEMLSHISIADLSIHIREPAPTDLSPAVLDCLNHEVPIISNCGCSIADLPEKAIWRLARHFGKDDLVEALEKIRLNPRLRQEMKLQGSSFLRAHHAPRRCADMFFQAIESFYETGSLGLAGVSREVARLERIDDVEGECLALARSMAMNQPIRTERQLLVDISELVERDAKTGIQRVVRSVLSALLANPPSRYRVEPVYASRNTTGYRYARKFTLAFLDLPLQKAEDDPVELAAGDIFLGLDLQTEVTARQADCLSLMRRLGIRVYFVVYDLLPVLLHLGFPEGASVNHVRWLRMVSQSDGLICISRSVAEEVTEWLTTSRTERNRPLKVGWFHLGADVAGSLPTRGMPDDAGINLETFAARPTFLTVGTLEPRKRQAQILAAFEVLWREGVDVNLVIVGKQGWMIDNLAEALLTHPERNRRLFWLAGISDEYLEKIYAASACLIAASEGEGFGLPLIESAQHRLPILARDIPVFREVAGVHATYFAGLEPAALARAVNAWLTAKRNGEVPSPAGMRWLTWSQSTQQLVDLLLGGEWMTSWTGDSAA